LCHSASQSKVHTNLLVHTTRKYPQHLSRLFSGVSQLVQHKYIGTKAAHKMMVKFTAVLHKYVQSCVTDLSIAKEGVKSKKNRF
jgi:hypothetical protein